MNPFLIELTVVRGDAFGVAERRSLARDVERGLLVRIRRGVYAHRGVWDGLTPEARHVVAMRALAAVSCEPPVFSHWSAAVGRSVPVLDRRRLRRVHVTSTRDARRTLQGVAVHEFSVSPAEIVQIGDLRMTALSRTVVDVAGASPFREGVVTADGAMRAGVRRVALREAEVLVGLRRAAARIADVIGFAHPLAESAAESGSRCGYLFNGIAPPVLQQRFFDHRGFVARSDFFDPERRFVGEADGKQKLLDPALATEGAGRALWEEKRREDRLLACVTRVARWGWEESCSTTALGRVLASHGWLPSTPRATLRDYIAAALPFG